MKISGVVIVASALLLTSSMAYAFGHARHVGHLEKEGKSHEGWIQAKLDGATTMKLNKACSQSSLTSGYTCLITGEDISKIVTSGLKRQPESQATYGLYWVPIKNSEDFRFIFRKEQAGSSEGTTESSTTTPETK